MTTTMDDRSWGVMCETALDGELVAAYVTGRLGEEQSEAFEQHFFGCEACWALVQTATAARTSFGSERRAAAASMPAALSGRRWANLVPAAGLAAALAGVALFGVWRTDAPPPSGEVFRGAEQAMSLEAIVDGVTIRTSWAPVAGAVGYELRLYDAGGRVLRASEVDGQTLAVDLDVRELGGVPSATSLDVVALDGLGQVLLRSGRVVVLQP